MGFNAYDFPGKHLILAFLLGMVMADLDLADLRKCITETNNGIIIKVLVSPNSKTQGIEGVDGWRGCLKVRVRSRAQKGKANREVIELLSSLLSIPSSDISIKSGETSKLKEIEINGKELSDVIERIADISMES